MKYYVTHRFTDIFHYIKKKKVDIEIILKEMGYEPLFPESERPDLPIDALLKPTLSQLVKAMMRVQSGDVIVVQYPTVSMFSVLVRMARFKGARVVVVIHNMLNERATLVTNREITALNKADHLIVSNRMIKAFLRTHGCSVPVTIHGPWDYLTEVKIPPRKLLPGERVGLNMASHPVCVPRNGFIFELGRHMPDVDLWLYVSNFNPANGIDTTNVKVYPHIEEPDFPLKAQGHFGLLWDGPSLQQCQGEWGDNILYTLPHKMSLYFECHLPVVTWSQSASAPYLRENNLGILVDSLFDLNDRLKAVTPEEYDAMQQNVCRIAEPIAQGEYMREAMRKVDKDFRSRRYR